MELKGKVAVVTGGASGIGLASARAMIAAGAEVILADRSRASLESAVTQLGPAAIPLEIDLLDAAQCAGFLDRLLALRGKIDILHANAGTYIGGDLAEADLDQIDRMLTLNVNVVFKNIRSLVPHMRENGGGDIVVTSSVAGHTAVPWEPVYSASKWAVHSFVQTMRRQLIKDDIRVGSVSPGPVISALLADWPEENLRKAKENGALIEPEEIAEAVLFMLTRRRNVNVRDIVILPRCFDI
ncbi:SDR family oxidoreductase [Swaminathania salitolerans]|uniref:Ribitol 2-dehydrogenase n=1 Tax=Swaminathania salitolerans TaxID=182838 RepID=A0A511BNX7_9PROT|nr:SDR family oxidoreductase [Swaminathania salitolerans]GBQ15964.1 putative short-chain alcohol dehydrogenase [Swaminathania salitolerans LMG 21291]GEL01553.1 ribitol 2-dehydrogenase [Swaminathania salitolerans]